jgi:alcohol dehydrogenase (cytochrome c)
MRVPSTRRVLVGAAALAAIAVAIGGTFLMWQTRRAASTAASVESGKLLYQANCIACHGPDGDGINGVNFSAGTFRRISSDPDLVNVIIDGVPGSEMPSSRFSPDQARTIAAYVRSLATTVERVAIEPGDAARGRAIVEGTGGCLQCHRIAGQGAAAGTDLSGIGLVRSSSELLGALAPAASGGRKGVPMVQATTQRGEVVTGQLLNRSTFSLQLLNDEGRLASMDVSDLREYRVTQSEMPSYRGRFDTRQLGDVVSYLRTLRRAKDEDGLASDVSFKRILHADREPENWLTYSGNVLGHRHSALTEISPATIRNLELKWVFQARSLGKFEASPLVVDGVLYTVQPPNDVVAIDGATGRVFWTYEYRGSRKGAEYPVNRGLAILGRTLFMATIDGHLIALDSRNGRPIWDVSVVRAAAGYGFNLAPLVVKDKVIVGPTGGEYGLRGFVAAFDARTGQEMWRFDTVAGPGTRGHETWAGDSWQHGGGPVWVPGSYDADLNLTYWGVGNPGPPWNGDDRAGDNLFTNSVVALDADTGELKWHFQATPHDVFDYDAVQIPVLVDIGTPGSPRKAMLWANRNGFFYVLDRATGEFLYAKPFVNVTWTRGLDAKGRPMSPVVPTEKGTTVSPGPNGGTNWYSPSYSPRTGLFYVSSWMDTAGTFTKAKTSYQEGQAYFGGFVAARTAREQKPIFRHDTEGYGAVQAIDPATGDVRWRFTMTDLTDSGVLTTASDLVFSGGRDGYFYALDARSGALLWKASVGGWVQSGPISYAAMGRQYVAIAAGNTLFSFALRRAD